MEEEAAADLRPERGSLGSERCELAAEAGVASRNAGGDERVWVRPLSFFLAADAGPDGVSTSFATTPPLGVPAGFADSDLRGRPGPRRAGVACWALGASFGAIRGSTTMSGGSV